MPGSAARCEREDGGPADRADPRGDRSRLFGNRDSQPMYLVVARCLRAEFGESLRTARLSAVDLVMIEAATPTPT